MNNAILSRKQIKKWISKGFLSLLDQAIYSGSNFILMILLARWLDPIDFGAFSVTYALFSIFYQLHNGFISEPMSVLGPINFHDDEIAYVKIQTKIHFLITAFIGLLLLLIVIFFQKTYTPNSFNTFLIYLGLAIPFLLLPWFIRRTFYFLKKPIMAAFTSFQYAFFLLFLLYFTRRILQLNAEAIYLIMSFSALLSSVFFFTVSHRKENKNKLNLRKILKQNWHYGKWIMLTGIFVSLANQIQIFVTGSFLGLEKAGALKAVQYFNQPMVVIISTLSILVLPSFASQLGLNEIKTIKKRGLLVTLITLLIAVLYECILWLFRFQLEHLLYNGKYRMYAYLIPLFGLIPIAMALTIGPSVLLRAFQNPKSLFIVAIGQAFTSVFTSVIFIYYWGIDGAFLSAFFSQIVSTTMFILLYRRRITE